MKKLFLLTLVSLILFGCGEFKKSADRQQSIKQEALMQEANSQVGMPAIKNFQERKLMKMILELRDQENLVCYAYIVPEMTGVPVFLGKCIGYGLPYSTQYTNPERFPSTMETPSTGNVTIPQPDPNGLFMPESASGTWLMLINPETGDPQPVYCEPNVIVSPFKLK